MRKINLTRFKPKLKELFVLAIVFAALSSMVGATSSNPIYMQNGNITATGSITAINVTTNYLFLGLLPSDPVNLTTGEWWFNNATGTMKYYNGSATLILPSISGGLTSYTFPFSFEVYNVGSTYYAQDKYGNTPYSGTNGGTVFQSSIDNGTATGNGLIWINTVINVTTANITIPNLSSDLIWQGIGRRSGAETIATIQQNSKSGIVFSNGCVITNSSQSLPNGELIMRDLDIAFTGVVDKPCINLDYINPRFERCFFLETGNTWGATSRSNGYGIATHASGFSPPTPNHAAYFYDDWFRMKSGNATAIHAQFEPNFYNHIVISFGNNNQTGMYCSAVESDFVDTISFWWAINANNCRAFVLEAEFHGGNSKYLNVKNFGGSFQAGWTSGVNVIFASRYAINTSASGYKPGVKFIVVDTLYTGGQVSWGTTATYYAYLFENANIAERVRITDTFEEMPTRWSGSSTNSTATTFTIPLNMPTTPYLAGAPVFNSTAITGYTWFANATIAIITVAGTGLPSPMTCWWTFDVNQN